MERLRQERFWTHLHRVALSFVLLTGGGRCGWASLTVLVGEPFGSFGTMMPVGHTAVYLDRVCADGPVKLRMCVAGEQAGVVVARYNRIGDLDWIASPVMEFLYAAERPEDVPVSVTAESVWEMRQRYRRRYLAAIVPDGLERARATEEWWETAGMAYNRRLWGYEMATTRAQDEAFVTVMNSRENRRVYRLRSANCANFTADVVNLYFPQAVHTNRMADFGMMSPKQVAWCVAAYGRSHPEAGLRVIEVAQVPGTLRRSRPVRGAAEAALTTKRYLLTLLAIQPEIPGALAVLCLWHGRWPVGRDAVRVDPGAFADGAPHMDERTAGTE